MEMNLPLAQAPQELKPLKIGEHENELLACMRLAMLKVGIRAANMPSNEETVILIDFVRRNFGKYTHTQVNEAFELAITGLLDLDYKDVKCYENFSCEYVGRILSSYQRHLKATGQLKSVFELEREFAPPVAGLLTAPKQSNADIIEIAKGLWEQMQSIDFIYPPAYKALIDEGLLPKALPRELQQKFWYQAELKMRELSRFDDQYNSFFSNKDRDEWKRIYARKLVVSEYFKGTLLNEAL